MCYVNDNLDQGIELSRAVHYYGDDPSLQMDGFPTTSHTENDTIVTVHQVSHMLNFSTSPSRGDHG